MKKQKLYQISNCFLKDKYLSIFRSNCRESKRNANCVGLFLQFLREWFGQIFCIIFDTVLEMLKGVNVAVVGEISSTFMFLAMPYKLKFYISSKSDDYFENLYLWNFMNVMNM